MDDLRRLYGFKILHMTDFMGGKNEFRGWPDTKKVRFLNEFTALFQSDKMMEGITFRLDREQYKRDFIGLDRPRRVQLDTEYGLCFRNCAYYFAGDAHRRLSHHKKWHETKLHFVLESGHPRSGDAVRVFNEMKEHFESAGVTLLGSMSFMRKADSIELMIGDFLAYNAWSMDRAVRNKQAAEVEYFGTSVRGTSNIAHLSYREGGLSNIRAEFFTRDQYRRRRKHAAAQEAVEALK